MTRAVGWQLYKRIVKKPIDRSIYSGMRIRCYPDSNSASDLFYFGDYYEYDEMLFLARYLRPKDGFIDGGANIGTYSLLAASIVGAEGRIDAFEPTPKTARRLIENLALNGIDWVRVHRAALADRTGVAKFISDTDVSNRLVVQVEKGSAVMEVPCVSLDESLPADARYAMAKLDLEGAEEAAVRGAEIHLRDANPPVWQVEGWPHLLRTMGSSREALLSLFVDRGYQIAWYHADDNRLEWGEDAVRGRQNFFAISRSMRQEVVERLRQSRLDTD